MSEAVAPVSDHDGTPEGLITALKERPGEAAVTFFDNLGVHSHILFDPDSERFEVEVHGTAQFPWEEESILLHEETLTAEEVVIRFQILNTQDEWAGRGEPIPDEIFQAQQEQFMLAGLASMLGITVAEVTGE